MLNITKRLTRSLSTIKKFKPIEKKKKHRFDIENEKWVDTKNKSKDYFIVYSVKKIKIKKD